MRLRQAVLLAQELEPLASELAGALGLGEPFRDPGVGEFGLENVVFALGDCFLEVIAPTRPDTAAGRHLARRGAGGYMVIFDLEDLDGARERARGLDVRVVWQLDLPDISGTHLHPADMRGAIVSIDRSRPYGSWRWGGPEWIGGPGASAPGRLVGMTVAVSDPDAVATRWGNVLDVPVSHAPGPLLRMDGAEVAFRTPHREPGEGIAEIALELPAEQRRGREAIELGGVRWRLLEGGATSRGEAHAPA